MGAVLRPVGPRPAAVYWRRRVVLLAALAALVVLVVNLLGGGSDGEPAAEAAGRQGAGPEATPAAATPAAGTSPTTAVASGTASPPAAAPACAPEAVAVTVAADAATYAADGAPRLTLTVRNAGEAACSLDVGTAAAVELLVVSGSDRVWSSDDCQQPAEARMVTLEPGAEEVQSVSWQRLRSAPGCPSGLPAPQPGTYQVTGRVGEVTSAAAAFTLT